MTIAHQLNISCWIVFLIFNFVTNETIQFNLDLFCSIRKLKSNSYIPIQQILARVCFNCARRFNNTEILGCYVQITWYRDFRKAAAKGEHFLIASLQLKHKYAF